MYACVGEEDGGVVGRVYVDIRLIYTYTQTTTLVRASENHMPTLLGVS